MVGSGSISLYALVLLLWLILLRFFGPSGIPSLVVYLFSPFLVVYVAWFVDFARCFVFVLHGKFRPLPSWATDRLNRILSPGRIAWVDFTAERVRRSIPRITTGKFDDHDIFSSSLCMFMLFISFVFSSFSGDYFQSFDCC